MTPDSAVPLAVVEVCDGPEIEIVRALLRRYAAALPFDLGYQGFAAELAGLPAPYMAPSGTLLRCGTAGVVGLKPLAPETAEIKRLYVVPEMRGRGVGRLLLRRALDEARAIGYRRARLDSHRPSMGAAIALYRRLGFVEIAPYGPDLDGEIAFFEKVFD